jgi:hypothetical protein
MHEMVEKPLFCGLLAAAAANERGAAAFFHFSDCGILVRGQPGSVRTSLWNSSQALRIG